MTGAPMTPDPRTNPVPVYRANIGSPMGRHRTQAISSSILGESGGPLDCPCALRLALDFGGREPVAVMRSLLGAIGLDSPERLRPLYGRILRPFACLASPGLEPIRVGAAEDGEVLRQAFLLGLCTSVLLDPARPVVWTQASLTRRLELFDMEGFYA